MRILFCGLGGIGQRHLRNLRTILGDQLEVHAFRVRRQKIKLLDDLSIAENGDLELDYGVIVHAELDEALAAKPDLVMICNPSSLHIPIALSAAKSGCHIFMEKPVSNSIDGLEELLVTLQKKERLCYVGYNFRFHPALIRIKSLINEGFFGNIIGVQVEVGEYLPGWHKYEDYRDMYASRADLGGGVILSQIHEMDLIYWFFGMPETITSCGGKLSNLEVDVEDVAHSLMRVRGKNNDFPISLQQDFLQRPPSRTFKIVGDQGIVKANLIKNQLEIFSADGSCIEFLTFPNFTRNDMFLSQTQHLLDCIKGNATPLVGLSDGIQSLNLALAAKHSLITSSTINLKEWGIN